jgi:hypothetical protein
VTRRAAQVTQSDIARVLRAAKQAGWFEVEVKIGEQTITIRLTPSTDLKTALAPAEEIVL